MLRLSPPSRCLHSPPSDRTRPRPPLPPPETLAKTKEWRAKSSSSSQPQIRQKKEPLFEMALMSGRRRRRLLGNQSPLFSCPLQPARLLLLIDYTVAAPLPPESLTTSTRWLGCTSRRLIEPHGIWCSLCSSTTKRGKNGSRLSLLPHRLTPPGSKLEELSIASLMIKPAAVAAAATCCSLWWKLQTRSESFQVWTSLSDLIRVLHRCKTSSFAVFSLLSTIVFQFFSWRREGNKDAIGQRNETFFSQCTPSTQRQ